jgi:hypothetical protein
MRMNTLVEIVARGLFLHPLNKIQCQQKQKGNSNNRQYHNTMKNHQLYLLLDSQPIGLRFSKGNAQEDPTREVMCTTKLGKSQEDATKEEIFITKPWEKEGHSAKESIGKVERW